MLLCFRRFERNFSYCFRFFNTFSLSLFQAGKTDAGTGGSLHPQRGSADPDAQMRQDVAAEMQRAAEDGGARRVERFEREVQC